MARNEEKALTLFSKWTSFKKDFHSGDNCDVKSLGVPCSRLFLSAGVTNKRPYLASECESLTEAEKWRRELVRDITRKISQIQNGTHGHMSKSH
jgi:pre-mRNA-splicing factor ISY1